MPSKTPISRSPTSWDLLTRVTPMDGPDPIGKSRFAILLCTKPLPPGSPISRFLIYLPIDERSLQRTVPTNQEIGSRFHYARVSRLRKPRFPNSDSPRSLATPCCDAEILHRGFETQKVSVLSTCKTPMPPKSR
jgi:hypothetical protein